MTDHWTHVAHLINSGDLDPHLGRIIAEAQHRLHLVRNASPTAPGSEGAYRAQLERFEYATPRLADQHAPGCPHTGQQVICNCRLDDDDTRAAVAWAELDRQVVHDSLRRTYPPAELDTASETNLANLRAQLAARPDFDPWPGGEVNIPDPPKKEENNPPAADRSGVQRHARACGRLVRNGPCDCGAELDQ